MKRSVAVVLVLVLGGACASPRNGRDPNPTSTAQVGPETSATQVSPQTSEVVDWGQYLAHALDLLREYYYRSGDIEWGPIESAAWETLGERPTQDSAYRAIEKAIWLLHELHTFLWRPEAAQAQSDDASAATPPSSDGIGGEIGYLYLPATTGRGEIGRTYASVAHDSMRAVSPACGWVVDLRDNGGGSMIPMLLAVGPLLGDGVFLTGRSTTGETVAYSYSEGRLLNNGSPLDWEVNLAEQHPPRETVKALEAAAQLYTEPFQLHDASAPVAVLTSFSTASAGEIVVIALKGRPNTQFFGEPTLGVPTGNSAWYLDDGAVLVITSGVLADRQGTSYTRSISPDEIVIQLPGTETDEVLDRAVAWLLAQEACST